MYCIKYYTSPLSNRPFQMRALSCITSYPLRGLPYLAYDKVNHAMVNSMMLRSPMLAFEKVYKITVTILPLEYITVFLFTLVLRSVFFETYFPKRGGGGRKRLPKFKFSAKFPIGLHMILQIQIKKNRKWLLYYVKNYFNRKSVEVQPCTPLEIMLNGFCLKITR